MTIETKYSVGDEVWLISYNRIYAAKVQEIHAKDIGVGLKVHYVANIITDTQGKNYSESELFPSKQDLLNSL